MTVRQSFPIPVALAAGYIVLSAALVTWRNGSLAGTLDDAVEKTDAHEYLAVGQSLLSGTPPDAALFAWRGVVYPVLGAGLLQIGPFALYLFQLAAVAAALYLLARAERTLTGHVRTGLAALLSISLLLAPVHLMTEALATALAAMALAAHLSDRPLARPAGLVLLALGAAMKPALLPAWALAFLLGIRRSTAFAAAALISLAILALPAAIPTANDGTDTPSTLRWNFEEKFFPAVWGEAEGLGFVAFTSAPAEQARAAHPGLGDKIAYLAAHPVATVTAYAGIFWRNHVISYAGMAASPRMLGDDGRLQSLIDLSIILNLIVWLAAAPAVIGIPAFLATRPRAAWPAALIAPAILASAPLVYWQGDRVVLAGLICLLPFAGLGLRTLSRRSRH